MPLHQWDYLFAIGTIFAFLDAYQIGANDVANSFATSVSSKSLTLRQACFAAAICEFLGAVLVGARVAGTIKNSIISVSVFRSSPGVQLLAFTCALVASASWLTYATKKSWPVSTTYSIVSAVAGVGVATAGPSAVQWGWNGGRGLATIFAGFIIAPGISAGFAATVYMITKYAVFLRENSIRAGFIAAPWYFFGVACILTMSIIYKGAPNWELTDRLSEAELAAAIVGTGAVIMLLSIIFWVPFVYGKVVKEDYTLRWYHFFYGPLLWKRAPPEDAGSRSAVPNYKLYDDSAQTAAPVPASAIDAPTIESEKDVEKNSSHGSDEQIKETPAHAPPAVTHQAPLAEVEKKEVDPHPIEGAWAEPKNLYIILRYKTVPFIVKILTHGTSVDVHAMQAAKGTRSQGRIAKLHSHARQFDNKTEHMYSFLQVMTACTASFAHGANDVANAIGPYSVIYEVWRTGQPADRNTDTPVWILVFGGAAIVIGLATYGYNIMRILGNRLTLHSPSRGFSMELGAAITVLLASQYGIPVSTTMCITGATMGVALCNGDLRAVNWRGLGWILLGWVLTVPIVGTAAGCLMGMFLNAPHF